MCTRDRPAVAADALRLAVEQQPPPAEVVVVDAGVDDGELATALGAVERRTGVPCTYVRAEAPSLPRQRIQGVGAVARAEIVVLFDDDAFMHPGCAAALLAVYDADTDDIVLGVEATDTEHPPPAPPAPKVEGGTTWRQRLLARLVMADPVTQFVPYGDAGHCEVPAAVADLGCVRRPVLEGYRMTFRRRAFRLEHPETLLMGSAYMEDYDFSHRVARHGVLVAAPDAFVHHLADSGGRRSHAAVVGTSLCNQALTLRRHGRPRFTKAVAFVLRTAARGLTGIVRDGWAGRQRTATLRATARGLRRALPILAARDATIEARYRASVAVFD